MLLYFTCKNQRGIKMEKFWKALETELCARGLKSTCHLFYGVNKAGNFQIKKVLTPVKSVKGPRPYAITGHILDIKPAVGLKHVLDIDEIWVGYDCEGSPWSDNMGGRRIECDGLKASEAVITVAEAIVTHFNEYFTRQ